LTTLLVNSLSVQNDKCGDVQAPLAGYFCGRGVNHHDCPSTHNCIIVPSDAYGVCCPRHQQRDEKMVARPIVKPGSCPPSSDRLGICIARCSADKDCPVDHKCCGSCPR